MLKTVKYLKTQESSRSENFIEYYSYLGLDKFVMIN